MSNNADGSICDSAQQIDRIIGSEIFKMLSESVRVEIIRFLAINGASDITTIADSFSQDRSVISRHLMNMEHAGLLSKQKESRHVVYTFNYKYFLKELEDTVAAVRYMVEECPENKN